jgi:hypothetical protein
MKKLAVIVAGLLLSAGIVNAQEKFIYKDSVSLKDNNFPLQVKLMLNKAVVAFNSDGLNISEKGTKITDWIIVEDSSAIVSNMKFITSSFVKALKWNANLYFTKKDNFIFIVMKDIIITDANVLGEQIGMNVPIEKAAQYAAYKQQIIKAKNYIGYTFEQWRNL